MSPSPAPALPCSPASRVQWLVLAGILLIAAVFRFYGLAWDSGYLFHPDERKIVMVTASLRLPANLVEFLSPDSPLNPQFFAYGSFPIYLLKALSVFAPANAYATPWRGDLVGLALVGRALSTLFDLGTIVLIFLLARRVYNARVGWIAAACIALTVLHIQLSHFYAVDTLLTFLVVATMFFAARLAQMGKRRDALLMSVAFGLALATKVSALPLVVPVVVAAVRGRGGAGAQRWLAQVRSARKVLAKVAVVALAVFVVTQPYALLDPIRYFGQTGTEALVARGWVDYPYTRQYANTLPFIYQIAQSSVWGMGLPLGIFAWGGSALFVWRWWKERQWRDGFILSWALVYFLIVGGQHAKYLRYLLPLLPFLYLMAAANFRPFGNPSTESILSLPKDSGQRLRAGFHISDFGFHVLPLRLPLRLRSGHGSGQGFAFYSRRLYHALLFTFSFLLFTFSLAYATAFTRIYSREHPWLSISKWIYVNIPANATTVVEHWDDLLPVPMRLDDVARAPTEYRTTTLPMYDADDAAKLETLVDALAASDYVVIASHRLYATIARLPARYPMSSRYYRLLFSGQSGFDLVAFARSDPTLGGVVIVDHTLSDAGLPVPPLLASDRPGAMIWNWGRADESFTVYDHPLSLVFKKARALSDTELRMLLTPR